MNHAVNRRSFTAEEWIQLQAIFVGFMVDKEAATQGFLRVRRFPYMYHSTSASYSHFNHVSMTLCKLSN